MRGKFLRSAAAGGKNGQINALKDIFFKLLHGQLFVAIRHLGARGTGRRKGAYLSGGKVPFVQGLEHFTAYGACGAYNGYSQLLAHGISLSLGDGRRLDASKKVSAYYTRQKGKCEGHDSPATALYRAFLRFNQLALLAD